MEDSLACSIRTGKMMEASLAFSIRIGKKDGRQLSVFHFELKTRMEDSLVFFTSN